MSTTHPSLLRLRHAAQALAGCTTDSAIATKLDESQQTINNWSRRGVSMKGALNAEAVLGVRAQWVLEGVEPMTRYESVGNPLPRPEAAPEAPAPVPFPRSAAPAAARTLSNEELLQELRRALREIPEEERRGMAGVLAAFCNSAGSDSHLHALLLLMAQWDKKTGDPPGLHAARA